MRNQIADSTVRGGHKGLLDDYADVVYRAWRATDGMCRYEVEETLIQARTLLRFPNCIPTAITNLAVTTSACLPAHDTAQSFRPSSDDEMDGSACDKHAWISVVVQGLVEGSVRAATPAMAASIRRVLAGLHAEKAAPGVDAMLLRVYEPIIFRRVALCGRLLRLEPMLCAHHCMAWHAR